MVNESLAKQLATVFLEVVIAPDYTPKALDILKEKKNLSFLLMPGEFILAQSVEVFNLPDDLSAEYKLKSSMARTVWST